MRWSWHDVMALPEPVYRELLVWLAEEARKVESGDGEVYDLG